MWNGVYFKKITKVKKSSVKVTCKLGVKYSNFIFKLLKCEME